MANIVDYIKWRGDITFKNAKYNEIDSLIFARISYFPFERLITTNEKMTIETLANNFSKLGDDQNKVLWPDDKELFILLGKSERYKDLIITDFVNIIDKENDKQFSATTIHLPDGTMYISYRGTDTTIVGWKEDFNLAFMSHIESQISGKDYLIKIATKYPFKKIRIGGHSKGGNIAIYAAAFSIDKIKNRILEVLNYDGPGFSESIVNSNEYISILSKCHSYVPQTSIIGRCMYHKEDLTIVESVAKGILQHDIYSWQLIGKKFILTENLTSSSIFIDNTVTTWLEEIDVNKKKKAIDAIFELFYQTNMETFSDMKANLFDSAIKMSNTYKELDKETKDIIMHLINELIRCAKNNIVLETDRKSVV